MQETIDTADRIRLKARELFMQYGLRSVSMDDIAQQLGISKKTIYQFYADKDELVSAVVAADLQQTQEHCLLQKSKAKDAVHESFLAMDMTEDIFDDMNPALLFDMEKFHTASFAKFQQHKYSFVYKMLIENLEWGLREGLFREDMTPDVMVRARLEMIMLPFNQFVFPKNKFNLTELQLQLAEFYLYGIVTPKGHKLILKYKQERQK